MNCIYQDVCMYLLVPNRWNCRGL